MAYNAGGQQHPLTVPQLSNTNSGYSVVDRNTINQVLQVVFDLIERSGVPRSLTADLHSSPPRQGDGPPPAQRRRLKEQPPTPAQIQAAQVLLSKRTPMIMRTLLKSLWPGGTAAAYTPDAWILSRLWKMIREYDMNGRILSYHLNFSHETSAPGLVDDFHRYSSHLCLCWSQRLGPGWDERTAEQDYALLPPGMTKRPPDRLKRMLTAMLDEYVKNHTALHAMNPWMLYRRQPHMWAFWVKPFVRAFLKEKGIHDKMHGQYWYLLDEDAQALGQLVGYTVEHIQLGLVKYRQQDLQPIQALAASILPAGPIEYMPPDPPRPVNRAPPGHLSGVYRSRDPNDTYLLDEFMLTFYMRIAIKTPNSIPEAARAAFFARTTKLDQLSKRAKYDLLGHWYTRNPAHAERIKRGNRLMDTAVALYNQRAIASGALPIEMCWEGHGDINSAWVQEGINSALLDAETYRRKSLEFQASRLKPMENCEREQEERRNQNQINPVTQNHLQEALAELLRNNVENVAPPADDIILPQGDPLSLEEIYLIATAINETRNADTLPQSAIVLILDELRGPAVIDRIRDNLHLIDYHPPDATEEDMLADMWKFELAAPKIPGDVAGDGDNDGGGKGDDGGWDGGDGGGGGGDGGNWGGGGRGDPDRCNDCSGDKVTSEEFCDMLDEYIQNMPLYVPLDSIGFTADEYERLRRNDSRNTWLKTFAARGVGSSGEVDVQDNKENLEVNNRNKVRGQSVNNQNVSNKRLGLQSNQSQSQGTATATSLTFSTIQNERRRQQSNNISRSPR